MKAHSQAETSIVPCTPSATAPASPIIASAIRIPSGIRVRSGRPWSSSSACAATPIARKNAAKASRGAIGRSPRRRATRRSRRRTGARACRAGAGGSSSLASRRTRARRRRAGPRTRGAQPSSSGVRLDGPDHHGRPVREELRPDAQHAGLLPPADLHQQREPAGELGDVAAEEPPGPVPAGRHRPPERRHHGPRVEPPAGVRPGLGRLVELERRHDTPGAQHPSEPATVAADRRRSAGDT